MKKKKNELVWGEWYESGKEIVRYIPFHIGQQCLWDNHESRFLIYICGKMAGKSSFAPIWLDREIRKFPSDEYIVCAPTYKILDQGIMREFRKHFCEYNDVHGDWNETKKAFSLNTGGVVYFRSLDDPEAESINGIHARAIVIDELGLLPKARWDIVESRIVGKCGKILATTTPYLRYRWLADVIEKSTYWRPSVYPYTEEIRHTGNSDYFCLQAPSTINPNFSRDEFDRLKAEKSDWRFKLDYLGEFASPEGMVLPDLSECMVNAATLEHLPDGIILGAVDFGHGGEESAALVGVLDSSNCLWIFWEYYDRPSSSQSSYLQTANALKNWHNQFYKATNKVVKRWFCDPATDTWKQVKRHKIDSQDVGPLLNCAPAKKGQGSVMQGIDLLTARIKTGKLKIVADYVKALPEEAKEYRWDISEDGVTKKLKGAHHAIDCLRYLTLMLDRKRSLH